MDSAAPLRAMKQRSAEIQTDKNGYVELHRLRFVDLPVLYWKKGKEAVTPSEGKSFTIRMPCV